MNSIILQLAAKYLRPVIIIFSIYVLLRGHNAPGGGFIGGLLAAAGILFYAMAFNTSRISKFSILRPKLFLIIGGILLLISTVAGFFNGDEILTATWGEFDLWLVRVKLGTPILFDIGIYFLVLGALLLITLTILEELEWR